jgi:hypothetical protein
MGWDPVGNAGSPNPSQEMQKSHGIRTPGISLPKIPNRSSPVESRETVGFPVPGRGSSGSHGYPTGSQHPIRRDKKSHPSGCLGILPRAQAIEACDWKGGSTGVATRHMMLHRCGMSTFRISFVHLNSRSSSHRPTPSDLTRSLGGRASPANSSYGKVRSAGRGAIPKRSRSKGTDGGIS